MQKRAKRGSFGNVPFFYAEFCHNKFKKTYMNVFDVTGVTSVKKEISKEIGAFGFYCDKHFDLLEEETINVIIERAGSNGTNVTNTKIKLRDYVLALTYGKEAVGSFQASHYESFKTAVLLELCEIGNVELNGNDKIVVEFDGLDPVARYVLDGIVMYETNDDISDIIRVEEKVIAADQKDITINCDNSDVVIMDDLRAVKEVNLTHVNGQITKHSMRELRLLSIDNDPVAYVRNDGKTYSSYLGKLQIDSKRIKAINIIKDDTTKVVLLLRFDVQMQNLGLIK